MCRPNRFDVARGRVLMTHRHPAMILPTALGGSVTTGFVPSRGGSPIVVRASGGRAARGTFPPDQKNRFVTSVTKGKNQMPPWGDLFNGDEIEALWAYVMAGEKWRRRSPYPPTNRTIRTAESVPRSPIPAN